MVSDHPRAMVTRHPKRSSPTERRGVLALVPLAAAILLGGCADIGDPYYSPPPSYGGYGGGYDPYYRDDYYRERERERLRREQREVDRERERLEDERRRLERERESNYNRPPPPRETCPSGFSPSERKCTPEERKRGCKDMRLPGGLGCVKR